MPYFGFLHVLLHIDLLRGLADDHREFRHCARLEIVDLGLKAGRKTENHRNADNADAGSMRKTEDGYVPVSFAGSMMSGKMSGMTSTSSMGLSCYPDSLRGEGYLEKNYELLAFPR